MKTNMPIIHFNKFYLRDIKKDDYKDFFEFGSRMEVVKYMTWGPFKKISDAKYAIEKFHLTRPRRGLPIGYAIVYKENEKMIGTIDFHTYDVYRNTCEIGFCLNNEYWGKGIMTKALQKMIMLGFTYMEFDHLIIGHIVENQASKRVIEKCGFQFYQIRRNAFYDARVKDYYDLCYYYIDRIDYERGVLKWQLIE